MNSFTLRTASIEYESTFRDYVRDLGDEERVPFPLTYKLHPFSQFIEKVELESKGLGLPAGFVPATLFFLARENEEIVGMSHLRHKLNEHLRNWGGHIGMSVKPKYRGQGIGTLLLSQTVTVASNYGIEKLLVVCNKTNIASKRVIEKLSPTFEGEVVDQQTSERMLKYWINVAGCNRSPHATR